MKIELQISDSINTMIDSYQRTHKKPLVVEFMSAILLISRADWIISHCLLLAQALAGILNGFIEFNVSS